MDGIVLRSRRLLRAATLVALVAVSACAGDDDDDTLQPLPVAGGTVAPTAAPTVTPPTGGAGTTPGGLPLPTAAPDAASTTTSTVAGAPTGDWDGAAFDVGTITSMTTVGAYSAIQLDRLSYTGPDGRTVDAGGLRDEPVVAWWRTSPFSNVRVQIRLFVLAPDVEVLTLDPNGRAAACGDPPPAAPVAAWLASGTSALSSLGPDDVAVLTYADSGQVARIRLTRGC